ncbi:hypothetical protein LAB1_04370 [Roseibium sp. LAB1]
MTRAGSFGNWPETDPLAKPCLRKSGRKIFDFFETGSLKRTILIGKAVQKQNDPASGRVFETISDWLG